MALDSPARILYDENGNPVGVIQDGSVYRLQTAAALEKWIGSTAPTVGQKEMAASIPVTLATDQTVIAVILSSGGADVFSDFLEDSGDSEDMVIDGSGTPVEFVYSAHPTDDIRVAELRVVISANSFTFGGANFGAGATLANGMLIEITVNDGTNIILSNVQQNEDFLRFVSTTGINLFMETGGTKDALVAAFSFGGQVKLVGGSSDEVKITIRDNITLPARQINYLTGTFYGFTE